MARSLAYSMAISLFVIACAVANDNTMNWIGMVISCVLILNSAADDAIAALFKRRADKREWERLKNERGD